MQLFEQCLAPDTMGDGTGCDNMTSILVKLKSDFATRKSFDDDATEADGSSVSKRQADDDDADGETKPSKKSKLDEVTPESI